MARGNGKRKKLSREQIIALYKAGPDAVVSLVEYLQDEMEILANRIRALEIQAKTNSRNSSKPPSSDGFKKPNPKSRRTQSGKKPGGQPGHEGTTLAMVCDPDHHIIHSLGHCSRCYHSLSESDAIGHERRQVFDVPPVRLEVTEHAAEMKRCDRCGSISTAVFPEGVDHRVQYGARLKSLAVYLKHYMLIPYDRSTELLKDLFGVPISAGTLCRTTEEASRILEEPTERIRTAIGDAPIVHCDETGVRISKRLHWLHVAGTDSMTWYFPHRKRGSTALEAMGILDGFAGTAVHDGWYSYFKYRCRHGLCNAHHLRELTFVEEEYGQLWAKELIELLLEIKERRERSRGRRFAGTTISDYTSRYRAIINRGLETNPPPPNNGKRGRTKKSKPLNLLERLRDHEDSVLAFMYDFSVPFDNNLAERDLRMMKVQQKISGAFRSFSGAMSFCIIRSYISTVRKQGGNTIDALHDAFMGKPLLPDISP